MYSTYCKMLNVMYHQHTCCARSWQERQTQPVTVMKPSGRFASVHAQCCHCCLTDDIVNQKLCMSPGVPAKPLDLQQHRPLCTGVTWAGPQELHASVMHNLTCQHQCSRRSKSPRALCSATLPTETSCLPMKTAQTTCALFITVVHALQRAPALALPDDTLSRFDHESACCSALSCQEGLTNSQYVHCNPAAQACKPSALPAYECPKPPVSFACCCPHRHLHAQHALLCCPHQALLLPHPCSCCQAVSAAAAGAVIHPWVSHTPSSAATSDRCR